MGFTPQPIQKNLEAGFGQTDQLLRSVPSLLSLNRQGLLDGGICPNCRKSHVVLVNRGLGKLGPPAGCPIRDSPIVTGGGSTT